MIMFSTTILLLTMPAVFVSAATQCVSDDRSLFTFYLSRYKNETGHQYVKVNLDHDVMANSNKTIQLIVSQGRSVCGDVERVHFSTEIIAPELDRKWRRPDYEIFPNVGYYKLHIHGLTWEEARLACISEDAHLLVLNSDKEAEVVKTFFSRKPKFQNVNDPLYGAYVGVNDNENEGKFVTVTGGLIESTGYTRWAPGEPKTDRGQNFIAVEKDGLLHDIVNGRRMAFICEHEL